MVVSMYDIISNEHITAISALSSHCTLFHKLVLMAT